MIVVEGKYGIKATILAYSISQMGVKFITYEIEYPRLILAELNTHRGLSKNSFSSRAVPFHKMLEQLQGRPVRFGANQAGMQDKGEEFDALVEIPSYMHDSFSAYLFEVTEDGLCLDDVLLEGRLIVDAMTAWGFHKFMSAGIAGAINEAKYHKQVYNRLLEAHQMQKTIISGTEWPNFFWLRDDEAADPTIAELARVMKEATEQATPQLLQAGEWHLPYIDYDMDVDGRIHYYILDDAGVAVPLTLEQAIKVSCARCAAVSYRNEGYGLAKSLELYDRLVGSEKKHASALEHCATPIDPTVEGLDGVANVSWMPSTWQPGITHMDRDYQLWSGNLKGWIQYRKLIPGENYTGE